MQIVTKILGVTTLVGCLSCVNVYADQANAPVNFSNQPIIFQANSQDTSLSNWSLDKNSINLYFTGKSQVSGDYSSDYSLSTDKGNMTLHAVSRDHGQEVVSSLTDTDGHTVYSGTSNVQNGENFEIRLPLDDVTHSPNTGFEVKISEHGHGNGNDHGYGNPHEHGGVDDHGHNNGDNHGHDHDGGSGVVSTAPTIPGYYAGGLGIAVLASTLFMVGRKRRKS